MAFTGQTGWQAPQSMQMSGSMKYCCDSSSDLMQSTGHSCTQDMSFSPMQVSVITYVIVPRSFRPRPGGGSLNGEGVRAAGACRRPLAELPLAGARPSRPFLGRFLRLAGHQPADEMPVGLEQLL